MRDLSKPEIEQFRKFHPAYGHMGDAGNGYFEVPAGPLSLDGFLSVIASNGAGWDHVSVSARGRCPTWQEMDHIADLFFKDDETCMQLHVPSTEHVNYHPYTLHLWRPNDGREIPRPPASMVGPRSKHTASR
jgi:hypothetical protein